jgi:hypothetical protein
MDDRFRSRRFILAAIFTLTGCAGLFVGKVTDGSLIGLAGVVLGLYGGARVAQVALEKKEGK